MKHGYAAHVSDRLHSSFHRYVKQGGCQQIGEATSNNSTALISANELARTRALRSLQNKANARPLTGRVRVKIAEPAELSATRALA